MIDKRLIFILGAGASFDYGFPLGRDLRERIIEQLSNPQSGQYRVLQELEHRDTDIDIFKESLRFSGKTSIDAFLEHRADLIDIGKRAIAAALIPTERVEALFPARDHWYERLYQRMNAPFDDFGKNNVGFITLNYDRSLEHYMFTALKNTYNRSDEHTAVQLAPIPFVHVHGGLGRLRWARSFNAATRGEELQISIRDYDSSLSAEAVRMAAMGIHIIHEETEAQAFQYAKQLMDEADHILLIGFGYDPINIKRLGLLTCIRPKVGTTYKMTNREIGEGITKMVHCTPMSPDVDALKFMREHCP